MSDEYQTGTPSGNEAPDDDDVGMSPSVDEDTQDTGSGSDENEDTDSKRGPDPDVLARRVQELEERVSGGTRSWQEERAARQQAEQRAAQLAAREESWRRAGINIEEVDREVQRLSGAAVTQDPAGGQQRQPQGVTLEQVQQVTWHQNVLRDWEYEKRSFRRENPELATPEVNRYLDSIAIELADQELKTYGRIISTPDVIFKKSEAALRKMQTDMEKCAARKQSETRQKVKGQGISEGSQPRRKPSSGETDEPVMTDADQVNFFRSATANTRRLQRPS